MPFFVAIKEGRRLFGNPVVALNLGLMQACERDRSG